MDACTTRTISRYCFGKDKHKIKTIVDEDGSDSAIVDNALEFLALAMEPESSDAVNSYFWFTTKLMMQCSAFYGITVTSWSRGMDRR